jgi:uncharacterized membrane protein
VAIGWDVAAAAFIGLTWVHVGPMSAEETGFHATREDPTRRGAELLVTGAALASLMAVLVLLVRAGQLHGPAKAATIGLGVLTVLLSWVAIQTIFTLDYARRYYTPPGGGISFNEDEPPNYGDFAYVAFDLGMTYQVADTNVSRHSMRMAMLLHACISYVFATFIMASVINLMISLSS